MCIQFSRVPHNAIFLVSVVFVTETFVSFLFVLVNDRVLPSHMFVS